MKAWKTRLAPIIRSFDAISSDTCIRITIWHWNADHQNFIARIFLIVGRESSHMGGGETITEMHALTMNNSAFCFTL